MTSEPDCRLNLSPDFWHLHLRYVQPSKYRIASAFLYFPRHIRGYARLNVANNFFTDFSSSGEFSHRISTRPKGEYCGLVVFFRIAAMVYLRVYRQSSPCPADRAEHIIRGAFSG